VNELQIPEILILGLLIIKVYLNQRNSCDNATNSFGVWINDMAARTTEVRDSEVRVRSVWSSDSLVCTPSSVTSISPTPICTLNIVLPPAVPMCHNKKM